MKRKYTEAVHAKRVKKVIEKKRPCGRCPKAPYFYGIKMLKNNPWGEIPYPCKVCVEFIGGVWDEKAMRYHANLRCPCFVFSEEEAVKRTWLALEEKGYL
ncbi:hypothetical protein LCGC14_1705290 [marine sediment metagenome]|uniref:Uncharacterized protein n=1 Tax=marine sediment metagenome TaxID=412755 RepID=A0A0F9HHD1_9ZZZZ|nr:hypothetical protein [Desulfobacterales bacterium]